ncbi:MAG: 3-phosphoglycerate dehydrogenase [Clostridia bacterium]|nr:3-phosphoglycerate dehydrogenase [Clostridia bacterium]
MYNILTLNKISKYGLNQLDSAKYACSDDCAAPDAIMVRSAKMHEFAFDAKTVAVARAGAGVNNIPVDACAKAGIAVFNTPGANANAVKELVLCAMLMASRKVADSIDWCKTLSGKGDEVSALVEKGKSAFAGPEILGKTLGVVGLGAIGALVANSAKALGMNIVGYDPFLSVKAALALDPAVKVVSDLDELFAVSDYITLHVPLNDATRDTVSADSLAKMKDGVRILNFARGELVNEAAIIDALGTGKAAAYVTDFPTDKQITTPGVTAIPHLGASTPESEDNCAVMAANELVDYLEKGVITNSVNLPNIALPASFKTRVCLIYNAGEGMADKITAAFDGCGVTSLVSGEKKGIGYTAVDVESAPDSAKLEAIDGVIRVRVLG